MKSDENLIGNGPGEGAPQQSLACSPVGSAGLNRGGGWPAVARPDRRTVLPDVAIKKKGRALGGSRYSYRTRCFSLLSPHIIRDE